VNPFSSMCSTHYSRVHESFTSKLPQDHSYIFQVRIVPNCSGEAGVSKKDKISTTCTPLLFPWFVGSLTAFLACRCRCSRTLRTRRRGRILNQGKKRRRCVWRIDLRRRGVGRMYLCIHVLERFRICHGVSNCNTSIASSVPSLCTNLRYCQI
jgi:hypothetical protein